MQQWEFCYIVTTHEVMILYNFTPIGSRMKEYGRDSAADYKALVVSLLEEGWEPLGNDHFKRPYQGPTK